MRAFITRRIVRGKMPWARGLVFLAVLVLMPCAAAFAQNQVGNGLPYPPREPGLPPMNEMANPTADANRLMLDSMKRQNHFKQFELMNLQRHNQMVSDASKLIELAQQLKVETDKGTPDTLSIFDIRKAELMEKLARRIQDRMRASDFNNCSGYLGQPAADCQ